MTRRELFGVLAAPALAATSKPNIVFILADDLGWGDLSCYNPASKIPTPNLDKLAADGMRFTDAHTPSAVCSPTRYGLMTGRYCWRSRLKKGVLDGFDPPLIESGRTTAASFLKKQGYATACFGKWHLGMQWTQKDGQPVGIRTIGGFRPGFDVDYTKPTTGGPNDHGFDTYFGISASLDMPPYCLMENRRTVSIPDDQVPESRTLFLNQGAGVTTKGFRLEQVIPAITSKAVEFIERQTGPFFLYVPLSSPHLPVVPNPEFEGRSKAGKYGDFVVEMDAAVGKILAALDKTGANKNTLGQLTEGVLIS
jgi:arylsulfatase A-like enzyme